MALQSFDAMASLTFDGLIWCGILNQRQSGLALHFAEVAQSVEQRTENPCVGSSILPLGTIFNIKVSRRTNP